MMRFAPGLVLGMIVAALAAPVPTAEAMWRDGRWVNPEPYRFFANDTLNFRPMAANQKRLMVRSWRVTNPPINHKGMNIGATRHANGTAWAYRRIDIQHCRISDVWRSGPGWHVDFIRIFGGGAHRQDVPTRVRLEGIHLHDGDALPIIIQDGIFDRVTLKDINIQRVSTGVQIAAINTGHFEEIHIINSPGIRVALCGRPGSIKRVYIRNSPGAHVRDTITHAGRSGAQIIYRN